MLQTASVAERKRSFWTPVKDKPVASFLFFWFILNIIQVSFTELTSDEGYYWFYAQHLQLGYYDHPPMIALMINWGSSIFPGEVGVRLFNVLLSTAGLYLFFTLLPNEWKKSRTTYLILLSAPLLHYLCFIIFPDGPLLFFSLLFLVLYKAFLKEETITSALLLGLSISLMAWSKYHGVLVLLFTVLANPKLLRSWKFYLSLFFALLLFAPHLWWQYQNDFPTLKYHLSGRTGSISFKHVGEYISQQLVAIGPGLIFIPFVVRTKDVFERTLKFIIIGSFLFFLVSSFKTFVHFHWTSIAVFPILYFAISYYHPAQKKKLFNVLILPFVGFFFIARLLLMIPVIPAMHTGEDYYQGRKAWAEEVAAIAGDRPVFMPNNLREASLYSFFSGKLGIALYTRQEKKSQYELWGYEDSLQGKDVMFLTKYPFKGSTTLPNNLKQQLHYAILPSFSSYYNGISTFAAINKRTVDSLFVTLETTNNRKTALTFTSLNNEPATLVCSIEQGRKIIGADVVKVLSPADRIEPGQSKATTVAVSLKELPAGEYTIYFGIRNGVLPDAILSNSMSIQLRK
jgi:hypothetical protein